MIDETDPPHTHPRSTVRLFSHPVHPMLVPFPIVCFILALVTDILHVRGDAGLASVSNWLLGVGLAFAALAAVAGFADYLGNERIRAIRDALLHMVANVTVVVIELVNFVLRLGNPDFIGSTGVYLSAVAVLVLVYSGWKGGELVYRHGIGVLPKDTGR